MTQTAAGERGRYRGLIRAIVRLLVALVLLAAVLAVTVWRAPLWVDARVTQLQLFRAGIHSYSMTIEGEELHYLEGGTGAPVVLVHGLGDTAQMDWAFLMPHLVRTGHHVFAMDLLGYGDSAKPANRTYSVPEEAKVVEAFLDAKHLSAVALVGFSMGGWVASMVALDRPQAISRLILMDSAGLLFKLSFDPALFTPETIPQLDALLALMAPTPPPMPIFVKEAVLRDVKQNGWVVKRALTSMLGGADALDGKFSSLKMPMLIIWGKQDATIPLALGEAMHRAAPQSVFEIYDGCGHAIPLGECGDRLIPGVTNFLEGAGPQAGTVVELPAK